MMICEMLGKSVHDLNLCVNPRNRKQRIRMNISFESDYFNIYDPYYTSEEELDSVCSHKSQKKKKQKKNAMVDESKDDFATSSEEDEDLIDQVDQADYSESDEED